MSTADLVALRAEYPAWTVEYHENAAGDYWSAFLPGQMIKASDAKALRSRMADATRSRTVAALCEALATEPDFAGWVAGVLTTVAAAAGGSHELVSGRPGSWEAGYVLALVRGTAGHADEDLSRWRNDPPV